MSGSTRLGRYVVRRRIGSGGFATVWLAYDESLDSPVAIKVLADNWAGDLHVRQRFVEEGRFLRKVESPHVVPVWDAGELDDGRPYLVMAYADQGNLADRLELAPLPLGQALAVVRQVGDGLHALHQRGVLHRDVKPGNVLFRTVEGEAETVRAMVGDLGLGKALDISSRLTMAAGTPAYVSPEQARGEGLDRRSDLYSLGALTYVLLAGRPPFAHASLAVAAEPPPVPPLPDHLPAAAGDVIRRALAPDRHDRWTDVPAYLAALDAAFADVAEAQPSAPQAWISVDPGMTQAGPRPPVEDDRATPATELVAPRRRTWPWVVAALVLLVAGAAGGWTWQRLAGGSVTVADDLGNLRITVPRSWAGVQSTEPWKPLDFDGSLPAVSIGTADGWQADEAAQGAFAGLLPVSEIGPELPDVIPGHSECDTVGEPLFDTADGDRVVTVVYSGCGAAGGVVIERVRHVADSRLLWVQVRADERATANDVLDSVEVSGL